MTGSEDHSNTRPISVAELLARNGTIGSPPVGGRRRRRRGNADAVTVAELTGEIPVVTDAPEPEPEPQPEPEPEPEAGADTEAEAEAETEADTEAEAEPETDEEPAPAEVDDDYADAVAEYAAHLEARDSDDETDLFAPPRRSQYAPRLSVAAVDAEEMSPDPVVEEDATDLDESVGIEDLGAEADDETDDGELAAYLTSTEAPLFGGQTVADDLARRGEAVEPGEAEDAEEFAQEGGPRRSALTTLLHGLAVVAQCVLAVALGAGLFIAFDQLWKWNNIVALVLSVLVILGLVVGVRVVRKTEDIGSTLIAVAVGALVTLGPLALLQSS